MLSPFFIGDTRIARKFLAGNGITVLCMGDSQFHAFDNKTVASIRDFAKIVFTATELERLGSGCYDQLYKREYPVSVGTTWNGYTTSWVTGNDVCLAKFNTTEQITHDSINKYSQELGMSPSIVIKHLGPNFPAANTNRAAEGQRLGYSTLNFIHSRPWLSSKIVKEPVTVSTITHNNDCSSTDTIIANSVSTSWTTTYGNYIGDDGYPYTDYYRSYSTTEGFSRHSVSGIVGLYSGATALNVGIMAKHSLTPTDPNKPTVLASGMVTYHLPSGVNMINPSVGGREIKGQAATDYITGTVIGTFSVGESCTQATSGATGKVVAVVGSVLYVAKEDTSVDFDGTHSINAETAVLTSVSGRTPSCFPHKVCKEYLPLLSSPGKSEPDIIIIQLVTNGYNESEADFITRYQILIDRLRAACPNVDIIMLTCFAHPDYEHGGELGQGNAVRACEEMAIRNPGVLMLNTHRAMPDKNIISSNGWYDGVHLDHDGSAAHAQAFAKLIIKAASYKRNRRPMYAIKRFRGV